MTNENNTEIVKSGQSGVQNLGEVDFQELFGFQEKVVTLGQQEVWMLKGRIMPYGPGARRLLTEMGGEILMPERIFIDGKYHANPHQVMENGKAVGVFFLKHGCAICPEGFRYLQPILDYVDFRAIIADMAMNTQAEVLKKSKNAVRDCSRQVYNQMKKDWKKQGDPDWWFVPTMDDETGLAFNQAETGEAGKLIQKLKTSINQFRKTPLRKVQTATDRIVFEKLFPEARTAFNEDTAVYVDNYGNIKKKGEDYANNVKSIDFTVKVPTMNPMQRQLFMELGTCLRDPDPEARKAKHDQIMGMLGGNFAVSEISAGAIEAGDLNMSNETQPVQEADVISSEPAPQVINPVPAGIKNRDFAAYFNDNIKKLTPDQNKEVLDAIGIESWVAYKMKAADIPKIKQVFISIAGETDTTGEITPDQMRQVLLDFMMDQDGKDSFLDAILTEYGFGKDVDFETVPDDKIMAIHSKFTQQRLAKG